MNAFTAFTVVMLVWTISDFVSKKTKSLLSSLFVASLIFLIGFQSKIFPETLLTDSSLLQLGSTVVGFIIVHIGTMISIDELKRQWKTVIIGVCAVLGVTVALFAIGTIFMDKNYVIGAIGAVTGGTVSIIIVQQAAEALGLPLVAAFPVLISALQGLIGFPLTSIILKKEAKRVQIDYRTGKITKQAEVKETEKKKTLLPQLPELFRTTPGTLFSVGVVVIISAQISQLTNGIINTFIAALLFGVALRALGVFKKDILSGIDAFGLMMLAIMIIIFGPLATISVDQLVSLIGPIAIAFVVGVGGNALFSGIVGKVLGYSVPMAIAVGLTSLYGFPGTMILSQEAAKSVGENDEEKAVIEEQILPKMIIAGFATVTITSVFITSILAGMMT